VTYSSALSCGPSRSISRRARGDVDAAPALPDVGLARVRSPSCSGLHGGQLALGTKADGLVDRPVDGVGRRVPRGRTTPASAPASRGPWERGTDEPRVGLTPPPAGGTRSSVSAAPREESGVGGSDGDRRSGVAPWVADRFRCDWTVRERRSLAAWVPSPVAALRRVRIERSAWTHTPDTRLWTDRPSFRIWGTRSGPPAVPSTGAPVRGFGSSIVTSVAPSGPDSVPKGKGVGASSRTLKIDTRPRWPRGTGPRGRLDPVHPGA
jgi:hypothetical protein